MWSLSFASKIKEIVDRPKQIFSEGAASSAIILSIADDTIPDEEFQSEHERLLNRWGYRLPNKEALYYYRLSQQHYEDRLILPTLGRSHSL
jgi:asparagine synthase (glutamine-hydrolysing)